MEDLKYALLKDIRSSGTHEFWLWRGFTSSPVWPKTGHRLCLQALIFISLNVLGSMQLNQLHLWHYYHRKQFWLQLQRAAVKTYKLAVILAIKPQMLSIELDSCWTQNIYLNQCRFWMYCWYVPCGSWKISVYTACVLKKKYKQRYNIREATQCETRVCNCHVEHNILSWRFSSYVAKL